MGNCIKYKEVMHSSNDCRRHKLVNIIERQYEQELFEVQGKLCEPDGGYEVDLNTYDDDVDDNYGKIYVLRKILLTPKVAKDSQ